MKCFTLANKIFCFSFCKMIKMVTQIAGHPNIIHDGEYSYILYSKEIRLERNYDMKMRMNTMCELVFTL